MADISKIALPSGTTYNIKDATARIISEIDLGTINSTTSITLPTVAAAILETVVKTMGISRVIVSGIFDNKTFYGQIFTATLDGNNVIFKGSIMTAINNGYTFVITCGAASTSATVDWYSMKFTDTTYSAGNGLSLNGTTFSASKLDDPVWPTGQNTSTVPVNTTKTVTTIGNYTLPSDGTYIIVRQAIFPSAGVGWRKFFESLSNTGSERGYLWRSQEYYNVNGDELTASFTTVETVQSSQLTRYLRVVCYSTTTSSYAVGVIKWRVNYFRLY